MDEYEADQKGIAKGMRQALGALPDPNAELERLLARLRDTDQRTCPNTHKQARLER